MKSLLFKKLSYNISRITLSVVACVAITITIAYAASTIGTNISAEGTLSVTATSTLSSDLVVDTNILFVDSFNDKVGIGTSSPYAKLSVVGEVVSNYFTATSTTATTTLPNLSVTGNGINIATNGIVYQNGQNLITSSSTSAGNLSVGYQSGPNINNYNGTKNTSLGYQSMLYATSTASNTALGYQALRGATTMSTAGSNTAVGTYSLYGVTNGAFNSAFGDSAMMNDTAGSSNIAFGASALTSDTSGERNLAFGTNSLASNTTGTYAVALGKNSGYGDGTTVDQRTVKDTYMTFLGFQASRSESVASTTVITNGTAIGKNARVRQSNTMILGGTGSDAVSIGVGTTTPVGKLHVSSGASATTTVNFGEYGDVTSKTCFNIKNDSGSVASFYFVGTTLTVENNACI